MVLFALSMIGMSSYEFYYNVKEIDVMHSFLEHDQYLSGSLM